MCREQSVETIFCSAQIHESKQRPKKLKNWKGGKIKNFKEKKGKNKYNMFERWIKKS